MIKKEYFKNSLLENEKKLETKHLLKHLIDLENCSTIFFSNIQNN